ncbi:MAG: M16 family metallopeptidase [Phycisphaerales bacterium]
MSYNYTETTLDNGLRICAEVSDSAVTAGIGFFVKTGARDETAKLMGVSHFLEHMMFKGTETLSAEDVDLAFDNIGAEHNAFTSSEITAYWGAGLPEVIGDIHDTLADILRPSLRQTDFDNEKKVIIEEIAMYDDQPFWVLFESAMEQYYGDSPLGYRVLGTPETINAMQRDELAGYFTDRYSADNTTVVLAGNLDFDAMVERIQSMCGSWQRTNTTRDFSEVVRYGGTFEKHIPDLQQHYHLMMMPSVSFQDEHKHAASALAAILGGGDGSRLHWALVDTGLAEASAASVDTNDQFGEQVTYAVCDPSKSEQVADIMRTEMANVAGSLTELDLAKVKAKAGTGAAVSGERPAGRMQRLGSMLTTSGEYVSLEEELASIKSLTIKDLQAVAEAYPWVPLFEASTKHA